MVNQKKNQLIDKCDALYVWHKDAVFRMAYTALGGHKEWALKLLEQCMEEVCAHIEKFGAENSDESKAKITAILKSRVDKIYMEAWRKLGCDDKDDHAGITQKDRFDTDQILIRNEFKAGLAKYVSRLTNTERTLVFMRYYMGCTAEELSKRFESSPEEIEKRVFLVKRKIAKMIMGR